MLKVNSHIHTPYSFSAFESIEQAFELAKKEGIQVLGINDFFVTDGYDEFSETAKRYGIYPLFSIEFIGLLEEEQKEGIRVNDPSNPGRTYFCGKALRHPVSFRKEHWEKLVKVIAESQVQVQQMLERLTNILASIEAPFSLDYEGIKAAYARELVRERHIAQALRVAVNDHFNSDKAKRVFLHKLYSGKEAAADLNDNASFEGELRSLLLKAGGAAFVPEDASSFLPIPELVEIVVGAGGIPCYPVLLDDKNGNYTGFEEDPEALYKRLKSLGIGAVELIPQRNNIENLRSFVEFFHSKGFLVSFGTEHNSPGLAPLEVIAGGNTPLDDFLLEVNHQTACVLAAHQDKISKGTEGYLDGTGLCKISEKEAFIREGQEVIDKYIKH